MPTDNKRIFASPLARRLAGDAGLDLASITGSGPNGRIVKADVLGAGAGAGAVSGAISGAVSSPTPTLPISSNREAVKLLYPARAFDEIPLNSMRKIIATRLTEAKQTIPHFYLRRRARIDKLLALRAELNAGLAEQGVKISLNDFIIKASARALIAVPRANVAWAGDCLLQFKAADIAIAVAIEDGLLTPVIEDCDSKTLSVISAEMKDKAARARDKKLSPEEYQGGSFSISNLGMMGVEEFDAVINPPQGAILAVGSGQKTPVIGARGGVETATLLSLSMSLDHRAIDGALGAELLGAIVGYLEEPLTMLA